MNNAIGSSRLPRISPVRAFATVFLAVFLFILAGSALVTFMMPETYRATARVVAPEATHLQLLQSAELLKKVSQQLNLPETLAARYGESQPLADKRVEDLLRRSVQAWRVPQTDLVEIRAYGRSPSECAQFANEVAISGSKETGAIRIVERAEVPLRPSRPNKPLNLALGAVVGIFLGTMAGGIGAKLAVGFDGQRSTSA